MVVVLASIAVRGVFGGVGLGCVLLLPVLWVVVPGASWAPSTKASSVPAATGGTPSSPDLTGRGANGDRPLELFGAFARATVGGAPRVTNPLVVAIDADSPETDPTIPVGLTVNVAGGLAPFDAMWSSSSGAYGVGLGWSFAAPDPGNFSVTVYVLDALGEIAWDTRAILVNFPPVAVVNGTDAAADVGTAISLNISVAEGVAPYVGSLHLEPNGPEYSLAFPAAGLYPITIVSDRPGPTWCYLSITDAVGGTAWAVVPWGTVYELPSVALAPAGDRGEAGVPFRLLAVVLGGVPPVHWTLSSSVPLSNDSGVTGGVPASSAVSWSGEFVEPGNATIYFEVVDAVGESAGATVAIPVAPPLALALTTATGDPSVDGPLVLNATVRGGVAPYDYSLSLSDGEMVAGNLSGPGPVTWTVAPRSNGTITAVLRVTDGLDRTVNVTTTVLVSAPSDEAPMTPARGTTSPSDPTGWVNGIFVVLVAVGGAVGGLALWWRRRTHAPTTPGDPSQALGEIRQLLQDSDGLERDTLGLLAEDAGISREAAGQALDRWIRAGRVQVRPGAGGVELLRWAPQDSGPSVDSEEP